jgi:hypothetical protein
MRPKSGQPWRWHIESAPGGVVTHVTEGEPLPQAPLGFAWRRTGAKVRRIDDCLGRGAIPNRRHALPSLQGGADGRGLPKGGTCTYRVARWSSCGCYPWLTGNLNTGSGASLTGRIVWSGKVRSGWPRRKNRHHCQSLSKSIQPSHAGRCTTAVEGRRRSVITARSGSACQDRRTKPTTDPLGVVASVSYRWHSRPGASVSGTRTPRRRPRRDP